VRELDILPPENLVPGSGLLLRGPYSLQAVYTLGPGDVLLLQGKIFAAAADYRDPQGQALTLIVAPYADATSAQDAFNHLRRHLDPYLQVLTETGSAFVFKDFQGRFGLAARRGTRLVMQVKLARQPAAAPEE
jgi:hypothetical protein